MTPNEYREQRDKIIYDLTEEWDLWPAHKEHMGSPYYMGFVQDFTDKVDNLVLDLIGRINSEDIDHFMDGINDGKYELFEAMDKLKARVELIGELADTVKGIK